MNPARPGPCATAAVQPAVSASADFSPTATGVLWLVVSFAGFWALSAFAQDSGVDNTLTQANMDLQVEIVPGCSITQPNGSDFGTLDFGTHPLLNGALSQQATLQFTLQCASGVPVAILMNGGGSGNVSNRRLVRSGGTESIAYQLYIDNTHSTVWDNSVGLTFIGDGQAYDYPVYGSVPTQAAPVAGTYLDNVQVTINF